MLDRILPIVDIQFLKKFEKGYSIFWNRDFYIGLF